jgi:hypothetical protein
LVGDRPFCGVILTVEHNRYPVREAIKDLLESRGYRRFAAIEIDDCYVKQDLVEFVGSFWRSAAWRRRRQARKFP